jgi:hypothetical protein
MRLPAVSAKCGRSAELTATLRTYKRRIVLRRCLSCSQLSSSQLRIGRREPQRLDIRSVTYAVNWFGNLRRKPARKMIVWRVPGVNARLRSATRPRLDAEQFAGGGQLEARFGWSCSKSPQQSARAFYVRRGGCGFAPRTTCRARGWPPPLSPSRAQTSSNVRDVRHLIAVLEHVELALHGAEIAALDLRRRTGRRRRDPR